MTDPRCPVMLVVLLDEVCEGSGRSLSRLPARSLPAGFTGCRDELKLATAMAAHLPLRVQTLAVSPDAVATLGAPDRYRNVMLVSVSCYSLCQVLPVRVLGVDLVAVAPVYHRQLREPSHCLLCPGSPERS